MTFRNLTLSKPDSFEQELLWAQDMPSLAQAAERQFAKAGVRQVKLIWGAALLEPDQWRCAPLETTNDSLDGSYRSLILKARRLAGRAKARAAGIVQVAHLLTSNETNWACLYSETDANVVAGGQSNLRRKDVASLALRCQSVLQTEHFHLDIQRLASAEQIGRAHV